MDAKFQIKPIGKVNSGDSGYTIQLDSEYLPALTAIEGFSHLQIVWWGHLCDTPEYRAYYVMDKPYKKGPEKIGTFATRSPVRPNPILISTVSVLYIDRGKGIITIPYIDAENGSPVLDIKPYHASERIRECQVPAWCGHWPKWLEDSAAFNWQNEFNF
jgi:tRNA (adenine37-N6)-methyltransferase